MLFFLYAFATVLISERVLVQFNNFMFDTLKLIGRAQFNKLFRTH